jgi:hypothetical protein
MTLRNKLSVGIIFGLAVFAQSASAEQPPDVVNSDSYSNTASGTSALLDLLGASGGINKSAFGADALQSNTTGYANTASGAFALQQNTAGIYNTAFGENALNGNISGYGNTATGVNSLLQNTTGYFNTANGGNSLFSNTTGIYNTGMGLNSLLSNTTGAWNTALGSVALYSNTTGASNAAVGGNALYSNTSGANNTAVGYLALYSNTTGKGNAGQGTNALYRNTTGIRNLGIGSNALYDNTTGSYNIALGFDAGYNVTTGSNNIEIGISGTPSDDGTIQIGVQGTQTSATIAGIYGVAVSGSAVYVTANGQLGMQASSERYKTDIATMPEMSEKLAQLRPVTFHYRTDPKSIQQYGLIAEEVDKVYPELVIRDGTGKIQGIHYEELAPMLLKELQQQQRINAALADRSKAQTAEICALERQQHDQLTAQSEQLRRLQSQVTQLLGKSQTTDQLVVQR